ncbi:MAG: ABC transporter permease subunit, partial [Robiginitalea sp.]
GIFAAIILCLVTDRLVYRYYRRQKASGVIYLIVSVGVMFVYNGLIRFVIGPRDQVFADGQRFIMKAREFKQMTGLNEGLAIKTTQAVTVVTAIVTVAAVFWFLNRTRTGKSMRAFSDNEDLALLSGINPDRVVMIAWIMTAVLATIAGTLYDIHLTGAREDAFRAPMKLYGRLSALASDITGNGADFKPTDQQQEVYAVFNGRLEAVNQKFKKFMEIEVKKLNVQLKNSELQIKGGKKIKS